MREKTLAFLMATALMSALCVSPVLAEPGVGGSLGPEWDAYMAQQDANAEIMRQNKANYDATATPLQKKVDALIEKGSYGDATAGAQIANLMASTPDWSVNYKVPFPYALMPGHVLIKTGYKYDDQSVGSGDMREFAWFLENGEVCSCNITAYPSIVADGGFNASMNKSIPKSGVFYYEGHAVYWEAD